MEFSTHHVDVRSLKSENLASAEGTPRGEQQGESIPLGDRLDGGTHLVVLRRFTFG
jgi:hypothetical protein